MKSLKKYKEAGRIASKALRYGFSLIRENVSVVVVAEKIENFIRQKGARPAFPANIGIHEIAAHYTPSANDRLKFSKGDLVCLDVGAEVDGYIGDTARTIEVGSDRYSELIRATEDALNAAIECVKVDMSLGAVGSAIESVIKSYGYKPISNLSGHSLDRYNLHAGKSVPNVRKSSDIIEINDVLAIEPFATTTTGRGKVKNAGMGNIYRYLREKPVEGELGKILQLIKNNFAYLPFTSRWIAVKNADKLLQKLRKQGIILGYPVLRGNAPIAQSEHTMVVTEVGAKVLTL